MAASGHVDERVHARGLQIACDDERVRQHAVAPAAVEVHVRARGAELVGEVERFGGYRLCYVRGPEGIIVELGERSSN